MGWGKVVGGLLGFLIGKSAGGIGGLFGLLLGLYFGHQVDKTKARIFGQGGFRAKLDQAVIFHAIFSVMGNVAKAKGQVTQSEIELASSIMDQMRLQGESRKRAQDAFREGKSADFPLENVLRRVKQASYGRPDLLQIFIEMQIQAAFADGSVDPKEREVLLTIASVFGFSKAQLDQRLSMQGGANNFNQAGGQNSPFVQAEKIKNAYLILGLEENAEPQTIKRAYRKLMNEHHPDKLAASGLPSEMMEMAKQKAQEIQAAYELLKKEKAIK